MQHPATKCEAAARGTASTVTGTRPAALNQRLNILKADPHLIQRQSRVATKLAALTGASGDYSYLLSSTTVLVCQAGRSRNRNDPSCQGGAFTSDRRGLRVQQDCRCTHEGSLAARTRVLSACDGASRVASRLSSIPQLTGKPGMVGYLAEPVTRPADCPADNPDQTAGGWPWHTF